MLIRKLVSALTAASLALAGGTSQAITIEFDYSLDTGNFFSADKRQVLNQVASIFESNIENQRGALTNVNMQLGNFYSGSYPGAPDYSAYLGTAVNARNQSLAADTIRIYVGATDLRDSVVGLAWVGTVAPAGAGRFSGWGGAMLFDTTDDWGWMDSYYIARGMSNPYAGQTPARNWYADADIRTAEPLPASKLPITPGDMSSYWLMKPLDFASVVMHEMGHVFGLGHSSNTADAMYGTLVNERSLFDPNDWLAMQNRGWEIASLTPGIAAPELAAPVPEPASYVLMLAGLGCTLWVKRRRAAPAVWPALA